MRAPFDRCGGGDGSDGSDGARWWRWCAGAASDTHRLVSDI